SHSLRVVASTRPHDGSAAGGLPDVATEGTVPAAGPAVACSAGVGGSRFSSMARGGARRLSSPTFATLRTHDSADHAPQQNTRARRYQRKTPIGNECIAQYAEVCARLRISAPFYSPNVTNRSPRMSAPGAADAKMEAAGA